MNFSSGADSSQWQWQECNNHPFLTCKLLADWQHGFFSKYFEGQPPANLVKCLNPSAKVFRVKQIHSNFVLSSTEVESPLTEGDGIISSQPLESVWCASADCTPVLIADSNTGKVVAIHSGWRGTASEIVPQAVSLLKQQGSNLDNLLFALGPAIDGKVYQVGVDVAVSVLRTVIKNVSTTEEILTQGYQFNCEAILDDPEPEKVRLDVTKVISLQIQKLGISPTQIAIAPYCTYQDADYFFSYRRTKAKKIQWTGIVSH